MDHYDRKLGVTGTERCKGQIGNYEEWQGNLDFSCLNWKTNNILLFKLPHV